MTETTCEIPQDTKIQDLISLGNLDLEGELEWEISLIWNFLCLFKIKLTHKPSLATNSCLVFEPQSPFTGVLFVLFDFWGITRRARLEKYIRGYFWYIRTQTSFQINHVVFT